MGKNPAFLFYPSDWTRDLDDQPLEIEGAWIRICCRLWWGATRGESKKSLTEWSYILRTHPNKTRVILKTLLEKGIATGEFLDNQNITIISRRMVRDCEISKIRREVGKLGGNPGLKKIRENLVNQNANQKDQPSVSVSVSVTKDKTYTSDFLSFYNSYPRKIAKAAAWKAWQKMNGQRPDLEIILDAIKKQSQSDSWKKDNGQFIPHPATWLNGARWEDDTTQGPEDKKAWEL